MSTIHTMTSTLGKCAYPICYLLWSLMKYSLTKEALVQLLTHPVSGFSRGGATGCLKHFTTAVLSKQVHPLSVLFEFKCY